MLSCLLPIELRTALFRRKPLEPPSESQLCRSLTAVDLVLYGVGCSVGAGIYCLIGIGANLAGPAISLSFLACGTACIFTSLAYAEFAARIPVTGSAYVYAYVTFGEFWGWLVGWNLTLGYGFSASVVARSWAEYVVTFVRGIIQRRFGMKSPALQLLTYMTRMPLPSFGDAYTISPLSMVVVAFCTFILLNGVRDSSRFNNFMTVLNVSVLGFVVLAGLFSGSVEADNLTPFAPHGLAGIARGAGLVFFAFIGFDMVACLSEEVVNPERNMPLGIVGSLVISAALYIVVSAITIGMAPAALLGGDVPITNALLANGCCTHEQQLQADGAATCLLSTCSPVAHAVLKIGSRFVSIGAIFALTSATFVALMGQPRIFYSMAQDGLLFPIFAYIHPVTKVPTAGIIVTGVVAAVLACFIDLEALANVISLGTLMVFTFVDAAVIILRLRPWQRPVRVTSHSYLLKTPPMSRHPSLQQLASRHERVRSGASLLTQLFGKRARDNGSKPTYLVLAFTILVLVGSVAMRMEWNRNVPLSCFIASTLCGLVLMALPRSQPPDTFQCPWVPLIPLLGIFCNAYMMGSLPSDAWLLTSGWLLLGAGLYFGYGIYNSKLGLEAADATYDEMIPLAGALHNRLPSTIEELALSIEDLDQLGDTGVQNYVHMKENLNPTLNE